jgi:hypothetical protein
MQRKGKHMSFEIIPYGGWQHNARLSDGNVELIVTLDVGPRIIRYGTVGGPNVFGEMPDQRGGCGEQEWMLRGGHRLWISPESASRSYELDNEPVQWEEVEGGVRAVQPPGPHTGIAKKLEVCLDENGVVTVHHELENAGKKPFDCAVWALSVMTTGGTAILPLPKKVPHGESFLHNQEWSIWPYSYMNDPRLTLGARYLRLRQDPQVQRPFKIGVAHRLGWVGYAVRGHLFVKHFSYDPGAKYPDGGVNFETFTNEGILELESLSPLETLQPGDTAVHHERWGLFTDVPECSTEDDLDAQVASRAAHL